MDKRHLIDFVDISGEDFMSLYNLACDMIKSPEKYSEACRGKIMATLFYEPSTRTKLSFQTAMLKLGGSFIGFADPNSSSVSKGESLRDTVKIVSAYADIAVIRHPVEGAAYAASLYSRVPIINAGDGGHLHPTQTMADMFTIAREKKRFDHLNIGFCGDLLNGRTVHSLIKALARQENNTFWLISTDKLGIPPYVYKLIEGYNNKIHITTSLDECIEELDILYMTRIQKERFASEEEYKAQSGVYVLTKERMERARHDLTILHPLPKVDEIEYEVDDDPRAKYFDQAEFGMYMRMALLYTMCREGKKLPCNHTVYPYREKDFCHNPKCISNHEKYLPEMTKEIDGTKHCMYCDSLL